MSKFSLRAVAVTGLVAVFALVAVACGDSMPAVTPPQPIPPSETNLSEPPTPPEPNGDASKIAFAITRSSGANIFVMDPDGSNVTQLTFNTDRNTHPAWSPDGSKIAYRNGDKRSIYVMNADGSNQTQLTFNDSDYEPSWSPDGSKIVFTSAVYVEPSSVPADTNSTLVNFIPLPSPLPTKAAIFVIDADGSNQTQLTSNEYSNQHPVWSPDGSEIAFYSYRNGDIGIFVMDADGSNERKLTSGLRPAWSPGGDKIAFISDNEISVIDADGSDQTQLTFNGYPNNAPTWSPDGDKIAFTSRRGNGDSFDSDIFVINADGSDEKQLTFNRGIHWGASISWSR